MSKHCHCQTNSLARESSGIVIPGLVFLLLPKCPACFSYYIGISTGVAVSMVSASYLRSGILLLCSAAILLGAARLVRRYLSQPRFTSLTS